jgi:hypothetical protein
VKLDRVHELKHAIQQYRFHGQVSPSALGLPTGAGAADQNTVVMGLVVVGAGAAQHGVRPPAVLVGVLGPDLWVRGDSIERSKVPAYNGRNWTVAVSNGG